MITIDLSLRSTGYCIWKDKKLMKYGIINTDNKDTPFVRAKYISDILIGLIKDNGVAEVFVEAPAFGARGSMVYVLQGAHFYLVANITNELGVAVTQVPITTIKKQFTGSGRADKKAIMSHMPKEVLEEFQKHYVVSRGLTDLCDAYALGFIQRYEGVCNPEYAMNESTSKNKNKEERGRGAVEE
jgi:Holliday junction resolvasome RuvABC endonuclease subunit